MNPFEEQVRRELGAAVRDVRAPEELPAAALAGGRRRRRRRRSVVGAVVAAPAALLVVGAALLGGGRTQRALPPAGAPAAVPSATAPAPSAAPGPASVDRSDDAARATYFAAGYDYDDAVELGALWNVDPFEAKATAGRMLTEGRAQELASDLGQPPAAP